MSRWDQSENHLRARPPRTAPLVPSPGVTNQARTLKPETSDIRHQTVNVWNSSAENLSKFYFITQCVWVDKLRCIVDCTGFTDKIFLNIYAIFTCSSVYLFISTISTPIHRRRYKVVAEQYCKISPLICMVCLFLAAKAAL